MYLEELQSIKNLAEMHQQIYEYMGCKNSNQ
jgi:hypothetical protein